MNEFEVIGSRVLIDDIDVRDSHEGRIVFGTVVPYDTVARVNDGAGPYDEMFTYGSFARSIEQRADKVKLFAVHNGHVKLPIGRSIGFEEQRRGLYGEFLISRTRDGDDALTLIKDGAVDSFSVGFRGIKATKRDGVVVRTEAGIREASLVGLPAYETALVGGVRSELDDDLRRQFDSYLSEFFALADPGTGTTGPLPEHASGAVRAAQLRDLDSTLHLLKGRS